MHLADVKLQKKPIAKALIIRATSGPKIVGSISSGPMSIMGSGLDGGPFDLLKSVLSGGGMSPMGMPSSMGSKDPEFDDSEMIKHSLRSIIAVAQKLEEMSCCCNPMPSWAEAKIYAAQKDILSVLGALMGREHK